MLKKHTITIPLGLGINTKTDEKLVEQGAFNLVCENASFDKVGAVKKRPAYESLSTTYYEPGELVGFGSGDYTSLTNTPTCVSSLNESVFMKNSLGEYFYSYNDSFVYKNDLPIQECKVTTRQIYSSPTYVSNCDTDYDPYENIVLAAAKNGEISGNDGSSRLVLFDNEKKSTVECYDGDNTGSGGLFGYSRATFTRVSGKSYYTHVCQKDNQEMTFVTYNKFGQPYAGYGIFGAIIPLQSIAICRHENDEMIFVMVPTTTVNSGKFIGYSGISTIIETNFTYAGLGWESSTARYNTSTGKVELVYATSANQLKRIIFNTDGTVLTADAVLSGATGPFSGIAFRQYDDAISVTKSNNVSTYYPGLMVSAIENYNTKLSSDMVKLGTVPTGLVIDGLGQNTYFGASSKSLGLGETVFARLEPGLGRVIEKQVPRMAKINETTSVIARPRFIEDNGVSPVYNMALTFFEINQDYKSNSRAILGGNLHFQGGFLSEFDGETLMENGFHLRCPDPEIFISGAGSLTGSYSYRAVLKFTDRNGQVTRSEPSGIVKAPAATSNKFAINIKSMPFGIKPISCTVEIYRNTNSGTTFYYILEKEVNHYSAEYAWFSGTVTDDNIDATITDNKILYTTGNVLSNNPGPACKSIVQGGNRLTLLGLEDENEIAYSKKKLFGESVNFSDFFRIRIDSSQYSTAGGVVSGGYMDDKLIIFKRNSIFYIAGDGPLETGLDNTFTEPELITSEAGCTDPRSVVLTPFGLMFKSEKGIYLLTRGLETNYIGSGVEEFNHLNVSSAVHVDNKNQVIFTLMGASVSDKVIAIYDYFTKQWSITKGVRAIDGDLLNGRHLLLNGDNSTPQVQVQDSFLENASAYSMKTKTPWIKLTGLQDFARIWTATILGKYKSDHKLIIKAYYDYDSSTFDTYERTPSVTDKQYQYQIHLKRQKCEAIQFEIYDSEQSGTGESMELTALTLEVGVKKGSFKLSADRRI